MAASNANCAKLEQKRKALLKKMWASSLFSAKRASYERQANVVAKQIAACKRQGKGAKGANQRGGSAVKGGKGGYPNATPEQLWRTDPNKRPIDFWGVIGGNLMGGEDEVIAVAKGAQTSFKSRPTDDRATIRGGLAVLAAAGRSNVDARRLSSQIIQGPKADQALIKAAGGSGTGAAALTSAANLVRRAVSAAGLEKAAWGARGLYILDNLKGFNAARTTGATVSSFFGPIGMIIGAAVGIHGAVSAQVAAEAKQRFTRWMKEGLRTGAKGAKGESSDVPPQAPDAPGPAALPSVPLRESRPWLYFGAAAAVTAVVVYAVRQRAKTARVTRVYRSAS